MSTFGIKQSFRSQSIARKFARNSSASSSSSSLSNSNEEKVEVNVFENGNSSFASNVLNRKNVNVQISLNTHNNNSSSSSKVFQNELAKTKDNSDKPVIRKLVNARLLHMKNYNKAVIKSADHM
jgi:hypothetical protein